MTHRTFACCWRERSCLEQKLHDLLVSFFGGDSNRLVFARGRIRSPVVKKKLHDLLVSFFGGSSNRLVAKIGRIRSPVLKQKLHNFLMSIFRGVESPRLEDLCPRD